MSAVDRTSIAEIADSAWEALASRRVFFGHQSVGRDIMNGVRRLLQDHPEIKINLVESDTPASVEGPAFIDARIGRNREPGTKDAAFAAAIEGGFGREDGDLAMYKYCYVDVRPDTDPDRLFQAYASRVQAVRESRSGLTLVHFTVPLRVAPTGAREKVLTYLGRPTQTALNIKRERYNQLLRDRYGETEPVFDLARIESTRADGSVASSRHRGQAVPMLAPEWTSDGGHLNEPAQVRTAERLLVFLARLSGETAEVSEPADPAGRRIDQNQERGEQG